MVTATNPATTNDPNDPAIPPNLPPISAKDFREPLLKTLGELTGLTPGTEVEYEKTYAPTFARMNIVDDEAYGRTPQNIAWPKRWIQFAFSYLCEQGLCKKGTSSNRGVWALTLPGVAQAQDLLIKEKQFAQISATSSVPILPLTLSKDEPLEAQSLAVGTGNPEDYHTDPYIRALATDLKNTPCFGSFTDQAVICRDCPAKNMCINATAAVFSRLTTTLWEEDKKALEAAQRAALAARAPAPVKAAPGTTSNPNTGNDQGPSALPPAFPQGDLGKIDLRQASKIPTQAKSPCRHCKQWIDKGVEVMWVRGNGPQGRNSAMFHIACYEEALKAAK